MYEYIRGKAATVGSDNAVIEVGGVGYLVNCSSKTLSKLCAGGEEKVYIHMHISDDEIQLYGFYTTQERDMFRKLIGVSRIGRKTAISCLSVMTPNDIVMAVNTDNAAAFDAVPGMGRKTAQRVILELKEKVTTDWGNINGAAEAAEAEKTMRSEAIEALISLGYDGLTAGRCVSEVKEGSYCNVEELIRRALSVASGRN